MILLSMTSRIEKKTVIYLGLICIKHDRLKPNYYTHVYDKTMSSTCGGALPRTWLYFYRYVYICESVPALAR